MNITPSQKFHRFEGEYSFDSGRRIEKGSDEWNAIMSNITHISRVRRGVKEFAFDEMSQAQRQKISKKQAIKEAQVDVSISA